jgi:hydrogenase-4 component B
MQVQILLWCVFALLITTGVSVCLSKRSAATALIYGAAAAISAAACATALVVLYDGQQESLRLPLGLPWVGANFHIDALSAFFLGVINFGAMAASLYGLGYGQHERSPERVLPFFAAFLAGMNLVVLSDDAFTFLLSWEFMSLTSWALVLAHYRSLANIHAGYVYILMASFGTFALLLAYGLLAGPDGHYGFESIRSHHLTAFYSALVLGLALIGAGSKAGLFPLHVWLPLAHPAAPSHVSALMSGVMTKVAVYAFIRIVFDLLGPPIWWWGIVVLALGGATTLMGVLYALFQSDMKRALAYSTIENIGFVFVGLGLALAFHADHFEVAAILAFTAALFHVFNHSVFKSLLFFGSGAVLTATGERNMENLGGLIHRMPYTAFAVLAGCMAISALPPLNGFASEWLTFQAILLSPELPQWGLKLLVPAIGATLALSVALAAACFVRVFGIAFLGRPRTSAAADAHEVDKYSIGVMLFLALICLLAGILPGFVIDAIAPAVTVVLGNHMPTQSTVPWLSIAPITQGRSTYNALLVFVFITISASLSAYAIHILATKAKRRAPAWDGGFPEASPLTQYTASSFAQPIRRVFGTLVFRVREDVEIPPPGDTRPAKLKLDLNDIVWDIIYAPISGAVTFLADQLNILQFLTIRRYLSLVFGALVVLLLVIAIWR